MQRVLLASTLCVIFAACGGDSKSSPSATSVATNAAASPAASATPEADAALAASILMTRDDFPRDYLEKKSVTSAATDAIAACRSASASTPTAMVGTDDWLFDGQSPAISEIATVFASGADAAAHVSAAPAMIDCVVRAINDGKFNATGTTLSGATSAAITIEPAGNNAAAFAIQATQTFAGQRSTSTAQYTLAFVSKGRVVCELLIRGTGVPFDPDELSDFVATAAEKIPAQ